MSSVSIRPHFPAAAPVAASLHATIQGARLDSDNHIPEDQTHRLSQNSQKTSVQLLIQNNVFLSISLERAQPALASENADAEAAFVFCVGFDACDQWQPARHARAGAGRDHAHLAGI